MEHPEITKSFDQESCLQQIEKILKIGIPKEELDTKTFEKLPSELTKELELGVLVENFYQHMPIEKEKAIAGDLKGKNIEIIPKLFNLFSKYAKGSQEKAIVVALLEQTIEFLKKKQSPRLFVFHAVLLVYRHPNLDVKYLDIAVPSDEEWKKLYNDHTTTMDIPEYALDKHTVKGKSMKRGIEHFFEEGAKVTNIPFDDIYFQISKQLYLKMEKEWGTRKAKYARMRAFIRQNRTGKSESKKSSKKQVEESDSDSEDSSSSSSSSSDSDSSDDEQDVKMQTSSLGKRKDKEEIKEEKQEKTEKIEENVKKSKQEISNEDFAWDGSELETSLLYSEKDVFSSHLQTQKICGGKPPTYFAEFTLDSHSAKVFVKGPLTNAKNGNIACFVDEMKSGMQVNKVGTHRVTLIESFGFQDTKRSGSKGVFLLMKDLGKGVPYDNSEGCAKNTGCSMLGSYLKTHKDDLSCLNEEQWFEYVKILLFRKVLGVSDSNNRNIVISEANGNKLYSVDEAECFKWTKTMDLKDLFAQRAAGAIVAKVAAVIKKHKEKTATLLKSWENYMKSTEAESIWNKFNMEKKELSIVQSHIATLQNCLKDF
jgi:hypothetical protein